MSVVYRCDRCAEIMEACALNVMGRDLCAKCETELRVWLSAPTTRFKPATGTRTKGPRNAPEASLAVCRLVADGAGKVSARSFAEATGEEFRASYQRLRHLHRRGLIEHVVGSVYQLKSQEAAE